MGLWLPYIAVVDPCLCSHLGNVQGVLDLLDGMHYHWSRPAGPTTPATTQIESRRPPADHRPAHELHRAWLWFSSTNVRVDGLTVLEDNEKKGLVSGDAGI
jgi:hypothetical protein